MSCRRCGNLVGHQPSCFLHADAEEQSRLDDVAAKQAYAIYEGERRQFHHDIVQIVVRESLHMLVTSGPIAPEELGKAAGELARIAHVFADATYPPPGRHL